MTIKHLIPVSLAIVLLVFLFLPPSVSATTTSTVRLGGLDLWHYCVAQGQGSVSLNGSTWQCEPSGTAIDLTAVCQTQYGNTSATASQDVAGNAYTWSCYAPPNPTTKDVQSMIDTALAPIQKSIADILTRLTSLENASQTDQQNIFVHQVTLNYTGDSYYGPKFAGDYSNSHYQIELSPTFQRNDTPTPPSIDVTVSGFARFQYDGPLYGGTNFGPISFTNAASYQASPIIITTPNGTGIGNGTPFINPVNVILHFTLKYPNGHTQFIDVNQDVPLENSVYTDGSSSVNFKTHTAIIHFW